MIIDYENGIIGGIIRAFCHYVEANNKYMHDLILTVNTRGLYHNYFIMVDLNMLKMYHYKL